MTRTFNSGEQANMWNRKMRSSAAILALGLATAACSESDSAGSGAIAGPPDGFTVSANHLAPGTTFVQVEELGNPLVQEVTIVKARHDLYDRTMPYNTAEFRPETEAFIKSFGRPQSLATLLGSVLYPDILIVDTSKNPATASWLSWALSAGWGGRRLNDDVVDTGLSAIFSSLLAVEGHFCPPGHLPLCTDNVDANDKANLATFPYVAAP